MSRSGSLLVAVLAVKGERVPGLDRLVRARGKGLHRVLGRPRTVDWRLGWGAPVLRGLKGLRSLGRKGGGRLEVVAETRAWRTGVAAIELPFRPPAPGRGRAPGA